MARAQLAETSVTKAAVGGHASGRPGASLPIGPARAVQVSDDFIVSSLLVARPLAHGARRLSVEVWIQDTNFRDALDRELATARRAANRLR